MPPAEVTSPVEARLLVIISNNSGCNPLFAAPKELILISIGVALYKLFELKLFLYRFFNSVIPLVSLSNANPSSLNTFFTSSYNLTLALASDFVTRPFSGCLNRFNKNLLPDSFSCFVKTSVDMPATFLPLAYFLTISEASSPILFGNIATPRPAFLRSSGVRTFIDLYCPSNFFKIAAILLPLGVIATPLEPYLVVNFLPKWFKNTSAILAVCTSSVAPLTVVNSRFTSLIRALSARPLYNSGTPIILIISFPTSDISFSVIGVALPLEAPGLTIFFVAVVIASANLPDTTI